MRTFKFLTLLALGLLIFGSAAFFSYELFIKPSRAEKRERVLEASAPAATPTPDPGAPEFQRLQKLQAAGKTIPARDGWRVWIDANPKSPLLGQARKQLGDANLLILFDATANPSIITYTVVKGDSLAKIAGKQHSNAELIQKANQLPNINLQIGQQLVIPALNVSLELDRSARTLTLLDNGAFLKEYALLSAPAAPKNPATINSKVLDKVAGAGGKRVAFGDKSYAQSEKTVLLTQAPAIVSAPAQSATPLPPPPVAPAVAPAGSTPTNSPAAAAPPASPAPSSTNPAMPGGYVLSPEDLQEIFPLVSRNTPVIIH